MEMEALTNVINTIFNKNIVRNMVCTEDAAATVKLEYDDSKTLTVPIIPAIVNVEQPNEKVVFVQFADDTKEVAVCSDEDVFNFETGVLICIFKKVLSVYWGSLTKSSGSALYNKLIKYAVSQKDAAKKARQAEREEEKRLRQKVHEEKRLIQKYENEERNERIREISEAVTKALKEYYSNN